MRIIAVYIIGMEGCRQGILPVIGQTQQCGEGYSPHAAQQSALLGVETIGPYAFVPQQMKRLVLVCVVSFLKNGHIIDAAFMQITVLIDIDRIDFYADIAEIFLRDFHRLTDVLNIGVLAALTGQHQDLLHAGICDDFHLVLDFFERELFAADLVVAVETAVDAIVLAIVGDIDRCKNIYSITEMVLGLNLCPAGHLLQKRSRGR